MKRIRKNSRIDTLENDVRKAKKSYGRQIYFTILVVLALQLVNYAFGDWVFLRADGVVAREKISVDSSDVSEVLEVYVSQGQEVKKGDPLLRINSNSINSELLALRLKENELRETTKNIIAQISSNSPDSAVTIVAPSNLSQQESNQLPVSVSKLNDMLAVAESELDLISKRLSDMSGRYDDGVILSPVSGEVGVGIRAPGEVLVPGETFLEVYYGKPYVYAYLSNQYMRDVLPDLEVTVKARNERFIGSVSEVIPFSAVIPREFQNSVKAPGRHQIAKIEFEEVIPAPLNQQVKVRRRDTLIGYYFTYVCEATGMCGSN